MERIGIAASKIAKGNLVLYNLLVVSIAFLFSLFIFVLSGATILFALIMIAYVGEEVMPIHFEKNWSSILTVCMVSLTVIMTLFYVMALAKNLKLQQPDH